RRGRRLPDQCLAGPGRVQARHGHRTALGRCPGSWRVDAGGGRDLVAGRARPWGKSRQALRPLTAALLGLSNGRIYIPNGPAGRRLIGDRVGPSDTTVFICTADLAGPDGRSKRPRVPGPDAHAKTAAIGLPWGTTVKGLWSWSRSSRSAGMPRQR